MPGSPWRPITSAPRDGTRILAASLDGEIEIVRWDPEALWLDHPWIATDGAAAWRHDVFTHWMPLPKLPKSTADQTNGLPLFDVAAE
jgi:hypothetical protein